MPVHIKRADLSDDRDCRNIVELTDQYAQDPMGGGKPLPDQIREEMIPALRSATDVTPYIYLCYSDDKAVGIANCFMSFSTFLAGKVLYIHDIAVLPEYRGQGLGENMLTHIEKEAKKAGCKALSLEVLENNDAKRLYERFGFTFERPYYLFAKKYL